MFQQGDAQLWPAVCTLKRAAIFQGSRNSLESRDHHALAMSLLQ